MVKTFQENKMIKKFEKFFVFLFCLQCSWLYTNQLETNLASLVETLQKIKEQLPAPVKKEAFLVYIPMREKMKNLIKEIQNNLQAELKQITSVTFPERDKITLGSFEKLSDDEKKVLKEAFNQFFADNKDLAIVIPTVEIVTGAKGTRDLYLKPKVVKLPEISAINREQLQQYFKKYWDKLASRIRPEWDGFYIPIVQGVPEKDAKALNKAKIAYLYKEAKEKVIEDISIAFGNA